MTEPATPGVADPARWLALYRAIETDRPDAAFRDPWARALAGAGGRQMPKTLAGEDVSWSFTARTQVIDRFVEACVTRAGVDMVISLAAGLDARPYRLALPPTLRWVEIDLPDVLDYKEGILAGATPCCEIERVRLDPLNRDGRRGVFAELASRSTKALVITEGFLVHLMSYDVRQLARDLAEVPCFQHWLLDLWSPALLGMMNDRLGDVLREAGTPYLFGPMEGPAFFEGCGWNPIDVRSLVKAARRLNRLPLFLRMMALLPETSRGFGSRPWAGVCLLQRKF